MKWLPHIVFLFLSAAIYAQNISFQHLGINEGLSQNSVSSIVQDSLGRLWIGTRDGLNIFDGTTVESLRPIRGDSTSLLGHFVTDIVKDGASLWVVTKNGLSHLNIKTLKFTQYPITDCETVLPYRGEILVGTKSGLYKLNTCTKQLSPYSQILNGKFNLQHLYTDQSGLLWIGTVQGAYLYSPHQNKATRVLGKNTKYLFSDSQKRTWAGTYNDGIYLLDNKQQIIKHFTHKKEEPSSIINNIIRDINEDTNGNIWVGTLEGLSIIDGGNYSVTNYSHKNNDPSSLSHNSILCILRDNQGSMWLGTYFGGINYYNPSFAIYNKYTSKLNINSESNIGFNIIGEMLEDDDNNLWIASEGNGVDCYSREHKTFTHYPLSIKPLAQIPTNVKALTFLDKTHLMIGTHLGGLIVLNTKTGSFKTYLPDNENEYSISGNIIEDIIPFGDVFLLGTNKGVETFDPKTEKFSHLIIDAATSQPFTKRITCLYEDSYGVLWIGTLEQGLYAYHKEKKKLKAYKSSSTDLSTISSNNISCVYEDHYFRLWFGTHGGGLNLYNKEQDSFSALNVSNSNIPSDFIQGIKKSKQGNIWVATTKGLSILEVDNRHFINYSTQNGFPLGELNHRALYLTNDGEVFAGGINGLVSFKEEALLKQSNHFNTIFSSLKVNGERISPNDSSDILKEDLPYTKSIRLKSSQNSFTIQYSACNYISTSKSNYRYKLENLHDNWINAGNNTTLSFSKLPPGEYNLRVQSIDNDETTIIDDDNLKIIVEPPIYLTWYAFLLYISVSAGLAWGLNKLYRARLKITSQLKSELQEKEQIKKMNKAKLNFFTNISHEFRTPLTLINGTLEAIQENKNTSPQNLELVNKTLINTKRLNNLIDELLDFRKLEYGKSVLKVSQVEINGFLEEIFKVFKDNAQFRNISYQLNPLSSNSSIWIDSRQMEKVFFNIISNAFKFVTDKSGKIKIEAVEHKKHVDILVSDNGTGISSEEIDNIFDPYFQGKYSNPQKNRIGSGIGLAFSKSIIDEHKGRISVTSLLGEGTTVKISILKGNSHFSENVLVENPENIVFSKTGNQISSIPKHKAKLTQAPENAHTILIVEDNKDVQDLLYYMFCPDYKIITADNGKEGLDIAIEKQPDLIISDVMMPVMSGTEMCSILKRNIDTSHIPIVLLTAKAAPKYHIKGLETGADDYISKPYNGKILKTRIKSIIHNRMLIQQKYKFGSHLKISEVTSSVIDQKLLTKVESIITNHIDDPEFNVQDFAEEMNLSRSKLYQKIKGLTGQTPNDLILSMRLKKAAELLTEPANDFTVADVAYKVGYTDPRYFSKSFKSHFGVSPTKYGKKNSVIAV
ncbi:Two component regulator propeller [Mariniphaga anaerophila]|uniref:histidine kinase n=1 Tax=Mariniphaga anaerophila TaxID=1484053 RepID=A0A1M5CPB0_9BACT|nr:hybrid sensor histidine kinase/response regulator transcription factor [Mariniphaga anaerophila]SHF56541.1 Two component regulator propeller [Mariniphaga anaerophila]